MIKNKILILKSILVFIFMQSTISGVMAQPSNWFGDLTTMGNTTYVNNTLIDMGSFMTTDPLLASVTKTNAKFIFNTAAGVYNPKWTGSTTDTVRGLNTKLTDKAFYGQDDAWQVDMEITITTGKYYTFLIGKNTNSNNDMSILETNYLPVSINSVSQSPLSTNVNATDNVIATAVLSQGLNSGEYLYLRYSENSWVSSQIIPMTFSSGTSYTASIPAKPAGSQISYYIFSSNNSNPSAADADFLTLKLNNNGGGNYMYTVLGSTANSGITSRQITFNEGTNYYNNFSASNMGTYGNTAILTLKGGQVTTWKVMPDDITEVNMYYRLYLQGASTLPVFDTIHLPWRADLTIPGNQLWENDTMNELILYPLSNGTYNIEVYYEAFYNDGTIYSKHTDNNGGNNYILNFQIDNSIYYGTCGIFEKYTIIDTTQIAYLDSAAWQNNHIGNYLSNDVFLLKGFQVKTFKSGINDVTGAQAFYRIYEQGSTPPPFNYISLPWSENLTYPGDQIWQNDTLTINILNGLTSGNYSFDIYYELYYNIGLVPQAYTLLLNNNGSFYKASFTVLNPVGINSTTEEPEFKVFPVPASDLLHIVLRDKNTGEKVNIRLKDLNGRTLYQEELVYNNLVTLHTKEYKSGMYILEIETSDNLIIRKLLIN